MAPVAAESNALQLLWRINLVLRHVLRLLPDQCRVVLKSSSTRSDANKLFDDCHTTGPCEDRVNAKDSDANSQRTIGVARVVVGGVGVAAGITLLVLDLSSSSNSTRQNTPHVIPVVGLDTLGLAGTF